MADQPRDYTYPNAVNNPPPDASAPPPSVDRQTGYAQPTLPGYAANPPINYNTPQHGYTQHPPGYIQPHPGYAPPAFAQQPVGYAQPSTNVVVVGGVQPRQTVVVERPRVNHILHLIITIFFWPWVIVWLILCIQEGLIF